MTADNESIWITESKKGDLKAYGKLAEKYQNMIFTLALRLLKNRHNAEDLCQDVLIKIYKSLSQYKSQAPFGAWVYRITYNESINKIRKLKTRRETLDLNSYERENWIETSNALNSIESSERKNILLKALENLSDENRFLIMSYYFEELAIKEIVDITNLTESNIKIKLHRARKVLYKVLSKPLVKENLI